MSAPNVDDSLRSQAVALAAQGFRVFPLLPNGRTPAVESGVYQASSDPARVHRFWSEAFTDEPLPCNIGIATGEGLVVLDEDNKNGKNGALSLESLELRHDDLPVTLTVATPSGGKHYYFRAPAGVWLRNSASSLGDGLDVRGDGGYVVAPGSTTENGRYEVVRDAVPAESPSWFTALVIGTRPEKSAVQVDLDQDAIDMAASRAKDWLKSHAELSIEGNGGDTTAYRVAARVMDFGLPPADALDLMLEHWNERCEPPWDDERLGAIVENAAQYRQKPIGSDSADVEFDVVEIDQGRVVGSEAGYPASETVDEWPKPTPVSVCDPARIPRREWLLSGLLARTFVTGLIAPGGMGKTNFVAAISHALVSGRSNILGLDVPKRAKVWYWNQEDDQDELRRRFAASRQLHNVDEDQLRIDGDLALFVDSGVDRALMLAKRSAGGVLKATADVDRVIEQIRSNRIDVFIVDPLVELHEADENNNPEMQRVWRTARDIAVRANCAVMIVAHTRKPPGASSDGHSGGIDSLRGAGSQAGVMRLGGTLSGMSEKEASALKVRPEDRRWYTKLESAKHNLTPRGDAKWFKSVGVTIANGEEVGAIQQANFSPSDLARPVLGPLEEALLAAFWTAIRRKGPFETVLTTAEWTAEALPAWAETGSAASDPKESIRKCRKALVAKGAVKNIKQNQWLALVPEVLEVAEIDEVGRAEVGSPPIGGTSTASATGSATAMVGGEAQA
jgi:hypothetical protein